MVILVNDSAKQCSILVPGNERDNYRADARYRETVAQYGSRGYRIGVFLSGSEPLLPNMSELLNRQGTQPLC